MKVYAIGDLHLATTSEKPMDIFGEHWHDHVSRLEQQWKAVISEEDMVLIAGDISWAMKLEQAMDDLSLIERLPGKKICIRGNHDYWWHKINYMNTLYKDIYFIQNTCYQVGKTAICGGRGWICPNERRFTEEDEKIYLREYQRIKLSLDQAIKQKAQEIILMLHYPPTNEEHEQSLFMELIEKYPIKQVVYGHLHDAIGQAQSLKGKEGKVHFHLVAADYLDFKPKYIECLG
ncbi:MAG: metallophosphoesterase [Cellulosilyticaceae bacterium]